MCTPRSPRDPFCAHPKRDLKTLCGVLGAVAIGGALENDDARNLEGAFPGCFWTNSSTDRWPRTRPWRPCATSLTSRWQTFDRFVENPVQIRWRTPIQWSVWELSLGSAQVRAFQLGSLQPGSGQVHPNQGRVRQVGIRQVGQRQRRSPELRSGQIRPAQVGLEKRRSGQKCAAQIRAAQIRLSQERPE